MPRTLLVACLLLAGLVSACSPALNWRLVEPEPGGLRALLPCKPDHASREVPLLGDARSLRMAGCEADGALFAVAVLDLADAPARLGEAQQQWREAVLRAMRAAAPARPLAVGSLRLPAADSPPPVWLAAEGRRPDGDPVQAQALWFARGTRLYHAVVYARRLTPEMTEPFFGGWVAP